jgi:hypothetical protein
MASVARFDAPTRKREFPLWGSRTATRTGLLTTVITRLPPIHLRHHLRAVDAIAIPESDVHQRVEQRIGKQMRLQPQLNQLGMFRVVIVFLGLHARVGDVIHSDFEVQLFTSRSHHTGQF